MVSKIGNQEDNMQLMVAQMLQKMQSADTDGTTGLSKAELSSIDTSGNAGGSEFLKSLSNQFDKLDTDGDGELTSNEISMMKPPSGQMGLPAGMEIEGLANSNATSTTATSETDALQQTTTGSTSTTSNSSQSKEATMKDLLDEIMKAAVENFTTNYQKKSDGDKDDASVAAMKAADTDGKSGLSVKELSSIDTSKDTKKADFVNNLINNFTKYDSNSDGQLSANEIAASRSDINSSASNSGILNSATTNGLKNLSEEFISKMLNDYKNGGLSNLTSSLNIAV